jgi:hypothetical protein
LEIELVNEPQFLILSFEDLLGRALKKYKRVVIVIDENWQDFPCSSEFSLAPSQA